VKSLRNCAPLSPSGGDCKLLFGWCGGAGETSGTTATVVVIEGWTITVSGVGDSRVILDTPNGGIVPLTVDHRLETSVEE
jgi:hypothetical protein